MSEHQNTRGRSPRNTQGDAHVVFTTIEQVAALEHPSPSARRAARESTKTSRAISALARRIARGVVNDPRPVRAGPSRTSPRTHETRTLVSDKVHGDWCAWIDSDDVCEGDRVVLINRHNERDRKLVVHVFQRCTHKTLVGLVDNKDRRWRGELPATEYRSQSYDKWDDETDEVHAIVIEKVALHGLDVVADAHASRMVAELFGVPRALAEFLRAVVIEMGGRDDLDRNAWQLAKVFGCTPKTVRKQMKALMGRGVLVGVVQTLKKTNPLHDPQIVWHVRPSIPAGVELGALKARLANLQAAASPATKNAARESELRTIEEMRWRRIQGLSLEAIGREFGCSKETVRQKLMPHADEIERQRSRYRRDSAALTAVPLSECAAFIDELVADIEAEKGGNSVIRIGAASYSSTLFSFQNREEEVEEQEAAPIRVSHLPPSDQPSTAAPREASAASRGAPHDQQANRATGGTHRGPVPSRRDRLRGGRRTRREADPRLRGAARAPDTGGTRRGEAPTERVDTAEPGTPAGGSVARRTTSAPHGSPRALDDP